MTDAGRIHFGSVLEEIAMSFIDGDETIVIRREVGKEGGVFRFFDVFPDGRNFQKIDKKICIYRRSMQFWVTFAVQRITCESDVIDNCMLYKPRRGWNINVERKGDQPDSFFDLRFALSSASTCSRIASTRSGDKCTTERNSLPTMGFSEAIRVAFSKSLSTLPAAASSSPSSSSVHSSASAVFSIVSRVG